MQVETNVVQYHSATSNVALFETDGQFWIGVYMPTIAVTAREVAQVPFYKIGSYFSTVEHGLCALNELTS